MARDKGTFDFSANFEVKKKGTIDARQLVDTFSDLLNFTESNFIPKGFPVSVSNTSTFNGTEYTNGIYECIDADNLNLEVSWKKANDLNGLDSTDFVRSTGDVNETVTGIKTFSSSPIIPAPTTDLQAATKKYVDDNGAISVDSVANVATDTILGRISAGSGESEELTPTQVRGLINVEDNADVTDTANVTSAGALMDSEVANLSQVKAFDSKDYAVALGLDDNYVTDAEKVVIGNTSGTNTGDQDLSGKVDKVTGSSLISDQAILRLENTSGENTGDQDLSGKVDKVTGESLISDQAITRLANTSGTNTGDQDLSGLEPKRTNKTVTASSYILLATDVDKFLIFSNACTVVVPNGLPANLEFQGKQGGTGQVRFSAESGGTLNVPSVFLAETAEQHCFFGIRTEGSDVSTILGTLKLS